MNTKLVSQWEVLSESEINDFLLGNVVGFGAKLLDKCYSKVGREFDKERWLSLENDCYFDKVCGGVWCLSISGSWHYEISSNARISVEENIQARVNDPINLWKLPSKENIKQLRQLSYTPFALSNGRPNMCSEYLYLDEGELKSCYIQNEIFEEDRTHGYAVPFLPLGQIGISGRKLFVEMLRCGLRPLCLINEQDYKALLRLYHFEQNDLPNLDTSSNELLFKESMRFLLNSDCERADLSPYHEKLLEDTELGHWSLWQDEIQEETAKKIELSTPLVARDPKSSINDGVVAIDFGTKSTVVVYQKDNVNIHPMRIGTGDLSKEIASHHYENPTIMEFINLELFTRAYNAKANKPYTRWKDLTISHTAQNSMQGSESSKFNTFLDEIKQWAGDKNRKLKIVGQHGKVIDLPPFLELTDDDFNPIEIYAYYLGLYINNLNNGIFMDYILSFPVTYEVPIRDKIIESFEKGLKKSLPAELGEETINKLTVTKGASEPAAYALTALQQYGFEPEGDERVFYSVFDFGGGTTDFDFGIYSEPTDRKDKRRFDYVIEHFGAGGDKFLGGENLLELLAFEVFKKNKKVLLEKGIQFEKHPEKDVFAGSEQLLSNSQEAKMNTKQLCIALRPFWEEHEDFSFDASGELSVTLTDINGIQHSAFALDIDEEELNLILTNRIEGGVKNFFEALRLAFSHSRLALADIDNVKIFLAGNSSQSSFVSMLFENHIAIQHQEMGVPEGESRFELFAPLGADKDDVEKPTGKTGVAFGLIESREGGRVKVVDHNIADDDVRFKYYLGESRKKKFRPLIDREVKFNQWNEFIDAYYDTFEIFFTDQPSSSTGQVSIGDSSIKKKVVKLDVTDEDALVYIRVVSPTAIEYVVANEEDIANEQYLNDIKRIEL
ncbi:molecular chaperone DnaK [Vibrio vulnificus]|uniref:molecular chaperone DnaK n=1 Tax=Vibrio vulnificus TaxID=672 RepID=UPI00102A393E|nr:molecular chaperone DnaK [Vibrio vulnificus]RZP75559.1 molecular chaperone DnaK [Vibrio vulnificus]